MEKYETCKHVISVGRTAVYVGTGCPRANMIRGTLVSTKTRCCQCLRWEGREDAENAGKGRKADPNTGEKYGWGRVLDYIGVEWEDIPAVQMSLEDFLEVTS